MYNLVYLIILSIFYILILFVVISSCYGINMLLGGKGYYGDYLNSNQESHINMVNLSVSMSCIISLMYIYLF